MEAKDAALQPCECGGKWRKETGAGRETGTCHHLLVLPPGLPTSQVRIPSQPSHLSSLTHLNQSPLLSPSHSSSGQPHCDTKATTSVSPGAPSPLGPMCFCWVTFPVMVCSHQRPWMTPHNLQLKSQTSYKGRQSSYVTTAPCESISCKALWLQTNLCSSNCTSYSEATPYIQP